MTDPNPSVIARPAKPANPPAGADPLFKASERLRNYSKDLLEGAKAQLSLLAAMADDHQAQQKGIERLLGELKKQELVLTTSRKERDDAQAEAQNLRETLLGVAEKLASLQRENEGLAAQLKANSKQDLAHSPTQALTGAAFPAIAVEGAGRIAAVQAGEVEENESETNLLENDPLYFTRFQVSLPLEEVAEQYRAWILGEAPFNKIRKNRLNAGVQEDWTTDTLRDYQLDLEGENSLKVSVRTSTDEILLRMSHPDLKLGEELLWVNLARLRPCDIGTEVEHAMLRVSKRPHTWKQPGIPGIVQGLLVNAQVTAPWDDFRNDARLFHAGNINDLVTLLLNPERDLPIVVVSRDRDLGVPLVDPDGLAKDLQGVAVVYSPAGSDDPFLLTDALNQAGLDRKFSVFDGGIRIYAPGLTVGHGPYRHPLFLKAFIRKKSPAFVRGLVARQVMARAVASRARPAFMRAIETWDLNEAKANYEAIRLSGSDANLLAAADQQIKALEAAHQAARREVEYIPLLHEEISSLQQELQYTRDLLDLAETEAKDARQEIFRLRSRLETQEVAVIKTDKPAELPVDLLDGLISRSWSEVGRLLRLLQIRFQDRLVVLPSAIVAADDSDYQYLNELTDLLLLFCTEYWESLRYAGDAQAAKILGDRYASHESDKLSAEARRQRTFEYRGEQILMERHLKRTHGHERKTSNRVIRVYFHWDAENQYLVIGWCGRHLPL